jgi:menaquinone-specific isochorismate synthase
MNDLLSWLEDHKEYPKVYWQERETKKIWAGCGQTHSLDSIPEMPDRLYFGGMAFSGSRKDNLWNGFPSCFFFAPAKLRTEPFETSTPRQQRPKAISRIETPDFSDWKRRIDHAMAKIERKDIEKVVLARRTTISYEKPLNPFDILRDLQSKAVHATLFLFQPSSDVSFIGATPEKLYSRTDFVISADALAGTSPIGKKQDLDGEKERREFAFVKQFIHAELTPLCTSHSWEAQDKIITTTGVHHLYNRFTGSLKSISDAHLIRLLHPTPAMAGTPRASALAHLAEDEPFDRGWYAAPIGWIGPGHADMGIGIRSALVRGKEMHLFAGTGIVRGSKPEKEWEELNLKIRSFL